METLSKKKLVEMSGTVKNILYNDPAQNFAIVVLRSENVPEFVIKSSGYTDSFVAVGNFVRAVADQSFLLRGEWTKHSRYGWRFSVKDYEEVIPTTNDALEQYLSCGLFKGIGPVTAALIVERFGDKTLDILKNHPEKLMTIKGISNKRAEAITAAYREYEFLEELMLVLKPYNVSNKRVAKIYKKYGENAIDILKENPYRLADEIDGFGFKTADQIARAFDIAFDDEYRIRAGILFVLHEASAKDGHLFLTRRSLLMRVKKILATNEGEIKSEAIIPVIENMRLAGDVIIEDTDIFLPTLYWAEKNCGAKIRQLIDVAPVKFRLDIENTINELEEKNKIKYAPRQREAIRAIENTNLLVITGGPGTGKTTIIKAVIQVFKRNFSSKTVKLVAPTGRAAKRMEEATGIAAKTIHRELEFKRSSDDKVVCAKNESNPIDADLIIVDESSMIDIHLFSHLIKAISVRTKVIFVGDVDQLPSVGPGNVFSDLITSGIVPVVKFDEIFRQKDTSKIIINADLIKKGDYRLEFGKDFEFIREDDDTKIPNIIKEQFLKEVKRCGNIDDVQVLSPFRTRTDTGVNNLNEILQNSINPKKDHEPEIYYGRKTFRKNDKVMQFRNDYDKGVFNGNIGCISAIYRSLDGVNMASVEMDGEVIEYDQEDFEDLDLAYATTIHKSQGSEYDVVIMPISVQHYIFLQRNMIYTAITRAKKKVVLIGTPRALAIAVNNNKTRERNSKLNERILGY